MRMEKMICRILLLIILNSCLCEAPRFTLNQTQINKDTPCCVSCRLPPGLLLSSMPWSNPAHPPTVPPLENGNLIVNHCHSSDSTHSSLAIPLISFTAAFVVNVTQSSYQAEENHSITLEWTFTTTPNGSWKELFIYCSLLTPRKESVLYQVHDGVEVPESQDEQFSGRVQSDKDVLREGRIRLHVSRLRTEDSGLYLCHVETDDGSGSGTCRLNVSAAADQLQPQRPTLTPEPERWTKIIWITAAVAASVLLCIIVLVFIFMCKIKTFRVFNKCPMCLEKII